MPAETEPLGPVLERHLARYPLLQAADLYKLIHQGVFGPGHLITDPSAAGRALADELKSLRSCFREEEPTEPLDPAGRLIRVHLAPLLGVPGAADRLLEALLATAAETAGSADEMSSRVTAALAWCRLKLPDRAGPLAALAAEAAAAGWPARHHSAVYVTAYHPAYRVVSAARWPAGPGS